jgi:hypothetical protein
MSGDLSPPPADIADRIKRAAVAGAAQAAQVGPPSDPPAATAAGHPKFSPEWAAEILGSLKFQRRRFDIDNPPPAAEPILTLGGATVLTVGNLGAMCGQSGTGKTHAAIAALSAIMAGDPSADCLGWAGGNPQGQGLIYLDFEMSAQDHHAIILESLRRAGLDRPPAWFYSYHLTGCEPQDGENMLGALLATCRDKHGGTRLALLDGAADLLQVGPNDESESLSLVRRLHGYAIDFATAILSIIHLNPGSDFKTRGHLGSQIERKAEIVIQLNRETESDIVEMFAAKARHKPIRKGTGPRFAWDHSWGGFRSVATKQEERQVVTVAKHAALARDLFAVKQAFTHGDATRRIAELEGINEAAAKKRLATLRKQALVIVENATGLYRLAPDAADATYPTGAGKVNLEPLPQGIC